MRFVELKQWSIRPHSCITNTCWNTCNPRGWRVGPKLAHARKCNSEIRYLGDLKGGKWSTKRNMIGIKRHTLVIIHSSARDIEWSIIIWRDIKFIRTFYWILFRILMLDPFWWVRCPWLPAFYTTNPNRKATRKPAWTIVSELCLQNDKTANAAQQPSALRNRSAS